MDTHACRYGGGVTTLASRVNENRLPSLVWHGYGQNLCLDLTSRRAPYTTSNIPVALPCWVVDSDIGKAKARFDISPSRPRSAFHTYRARKSSRQRKNVERRMRTLLRVTERFDASGVRSTEVADQDLRKSRGYGVGLEPNCKYSETPIDRTASLLPRFAARSGRKPESTQRLR